MLTSGVGPLPAAPEIRPAEDARRHQRHEQQNQRDTLRGGDEDRDGEQEFNSSGERGEPTREGSVSTDSHSMTRARCWPTPW